MQSHEHIFVHITCLGSSYFIWILLFICKPGHLFTNKSVHYLLGWIHSSGPCACGWPRWTETTFMFPWSLSCLRTYLVPDTTQSSLRSCSNLHLEAPTDSSNSQRSPGLCWPYLLSPCHTLCASVCVWGEGRGRKHVIPSLCHPKIPQAGIILRWPVLALWLLYVAGAEQSSQCRDQDLTHYLVTNPQLGGKNNNRKHSNDQSVKCIFVSVFTRKVSSD